MDEVVCPDGGKDCWTSKREPQPDEGVDIVTWLKAEMMDGMDHAMAHEVMGPAIFGFDENDVPSFEVYRDKRNRTWCVRAKASHVPAQLKGIFDV